MLIIVALLFLPELKKQKNLQAELERLETELAHYKQINQQKSQQLDWLLYDPQYLETIARDKLDLMKEGEIVIRMAPAEQEVVTTPISNDIEPVPSAN